jgi:polyisoprenoid-binding protein YceI
VKIRRLKIRNVLLILSAVTIPAAAAEYSLPLTPDNTKIEWTPGDVLHTVHGTFSLKSRTITFDPDSGKAGGQVVVDVASGKSGSEARDRRMHANVLESAKYPEAVFYSRPDGKLEVPGTSNMKLYGVFRIHGADQETAMDVQTKSGEDRMDATIAFDVPYVAWGMKVPSTFILKVNKSVRLGIKVSGALSH